MAIALTSVLDRMASTHIYHGREKPYHNDRMAQPLHLTYSSEWIWISALISDMEETNPLTMTKWLWVSSLSLGGNLDLENTSFSLKYSNFSLANGFVNTLAIYSSIATYWSFTTPLCTISLIY